MAESRQALATMPDEELAGALRQLATSIDFPTRPTEPGSPDLAARVRRRIEQNPLRPSLWRRLGLGVGAGTRARPIRRGLVLALVALLILAAVAGAVGFGLPGLRIIFGEGPSPTASPPATSSASPRPSEPSPSATVQPLGGSLGLGDAVPLAGSIWIVTARAS